MKKPVPDYQPKHALVNYCDGITSGGVESIRECPYCYCIVFMESVIDHKKVCLARKVKK